MHEIFNYFVSHEDGEDEKRLAYTNWFCTSFPIQEFKNEEAIFFDFMLYVQKLGLTPKEKYLQVYLDSELKKLLVERNIKVAGTETFSYEEPTALETALQITKETMLSLYQQMEAQKAYVKDFTIAIDQFMKTRLNERMVDVFGKTYDSVSNKNDTSEAVEYAMSQLSILSDIYDITKIEELVEIPLDINDTSPIVDTGIPGIDSVISNIRRGQLVGLEAPPGAGKTRFALGVWSYRAAVEYKQNVLYYALEQTVAEVQAMLVSRHVLHMFNKQVPDKMIYENKVPKELHTMVDAARIDLFDSGKYGKIEIVETNLYVEDFIQKIKNKDMLNGPFDLIVIDHMYLIESKATGYGRLSEFQILSRAYRLFKRYVRSARKGGIAVNQFNREGIEAAKNDKEVDSSMVAGGIEAHRNTDYNLMITYTSVMAAQQKRRISIPKVRSSEAFVPIILDSRLGCCYFYQIAKKDI